VSDSRRTILTLFGTRPEIIKLAPVLDELARHADLRSVAVCSGQHTDLLAPFVRLFNVVVDHNLAVMKPGQTPNEVCARVLLALDPVFKSERPDLVLVQGNTTTALAGAMAAFHHKIPVGHVEAGLRSGDVLSPYPEEMNRRLITQIAAYHFAATERNRQTLRHDGVADERIALTGNPVVDALQNLLRLDPRSPRLDDLLRQSEGYKRIVLTTHRRENFGTVMGGHLAALRQFVERHGDTMLIFPVHPNPNVRQAAEAALSGHPRILLQPPLDYADFIPLLARAWLIVSDSGGVQEEAPTLGTPLLVLRSNTERPESVECGIAKLVGDDPATLTRLLEAQHRDNNSVRTAMVNPFGDGTAAQKIVDFIRRYRA